MKDGREETVRTFIAIELPEDIRAAMNIVQDGLRKTGADVGWVRPEGVHLTLKFLGSVGAGRINEIAAAVASASEGTGPIKLEVSGAGVFPNERAPRVVWLGLSGGLDALGALADRVDAECASLGFERERRPFNPHLTLGRVKSPGGRERLMGGLSALKGSAFGSFTADSVSVMKSELRPAGAVYTEMRRVAL